MLGRQGLRFILIGLAFRHLDPEPGLAKALSPPAFARPIQAHRLTPLPRSGATPYPGHPPPALTPLPRVLACPTQGTREVYKCRHSPPTGVETTSRALHQSVWRPKRSRPPRLLPPPPPPPMQLPSKSHRCTDAQEQVCPFSSGTSSAPPRVSGFVSSVIPSIAGLAS